MIKISNSIDVDHHFLILLCFFYRTFLSIFCKICYGLERPLPLPDLLPRPPRPLPLPLLNILCLILLCLQ